MPSAPPPNSDNNNNLSLSQYTGSKIWIGGRANAKRAQRAGTSKHIMTINYKTYKCKIKLHSTEQQIKRVK